MSHDFYLIAVTSQHASLPLMASWLPLRPNQTLADVHFRRFLISLYWNRVSRAHWATSHTEDCSSSWACFTWARWYSHRYFTCLYRYVIYSCEIATNLQNCIQPVVLWICCLIEHIFQSNYCRLTLHFAAVTLNDDLDIQAWPVLSEDLHVYQKMNFLGQLNISKVIVW